MHERDIGRDKRLLFDATDIEPPLPGPETSWAGSEFAVEHVVIDQRPSACVDYPRRPYLKESTIGRDRQLVG